MVYIRRYPAIKNATKSIVGMSAPPPILPGRDKFPTSPDTTRYSNIALRHPKSGHNGLYM